MKRLIIILLGMLMLSAVGLATSPSASAGDVPQQSVDVYHNDKDYTKAEVAKITAKKQADAKVQGKTAVAMAGCYDWWQLGAVTLPGARIYDTNIGLMRLYWNPCGAQNRARVDHQGAYVNWGTLTSVMVCTVDGAGNCTSNRASDGPAMYLNWAEATISGAGGQCVKAIGTMVANRTNGYLIAVQLGPGWCG